MTNALNNNDIEKLKENFKYNINASKGRNTEITFFTNKGENDIQLGFWYSENNRWWVICDESTHDSEGRYTKNKIKKIFGYLQK